MPNSFPGGLGAKVDCDSIRTATDYCCWRTVHLDGLLTARRATSATGYGVCGCVGSCAFPWGVPQGLPQGVPAGNRPGRFSGCP